MHGLGDFTIGGVIRMAFGILSRHVLGYFLLALLVVALPTWGGPIVDAPYLQQLQTPDVAAQHSSGVMFAWAFGLGAAPGLVAYLGGLLLNATVVAVAVSEFAGQPSSIAAGLRVGLALFLPLLVVKVLAAIGIMVGSVLLVVPGMILAYMWLIVLPVYVAERPGIGAVFGRSRQLTAGHRWKIVGLTLIYGLVAGLVIGFFTGFIGALAGRGVDAGIVTGLKIVGAALSAGFGVLGSAGLTAIYIELRRTKEGTLPGDLVAAFE